MRILIPYNAVLIVSAYYQVDLDRTEHSVHNFVDFGMVTLSGIVQREQPSLRRDSADSSVIPDRAVLFSDQLSSSATFLSAQCNRVPHNAWYADYPKSVHLQPASYDDMSLVAVLRDARENLEMVDSLPGSCQENAEHDLQGTMPSVWFSGGPSPRRG